MSTQQNGGTPPQPPQQQPKQVKYVVDSAGVQIPARANFSVGGRTIAWDLSGDECQPTTDKNVIAQSVRAQCGAEAEEIVKNAMNPLSNFVPMKGAGWNFVSSIGTMALGIAATVGVGKLRSNSAGSEQSDNVVNFGEGNNSYNSNFG
jgi:hypothetical protein